MKKYIVTNFAYGTGPYLRTTELALAFNDELEKRGHKRMRIVVPLVYGEKQKTIMQERFQNTFARHRGEVVLDSGLGKILKKVFYEKSPYGEMLEHWVHNFDRVSGEAQNHLKKTYGRSIAFELARSPRLDLNIPVAYFTSFAYLSKIFEEFSKENSEISKALLKNGAEIAQRLEKKYRIRMISYPGTFNEDSNAPPIMKPPKTNINTIERGIFVTATGINGLERLFKDAANFTVRVYSNDPKSVPGSIKSSPDIIPNKNIIFQFARSGWSSIWTSLLAGTPVVIPDFDHLDDPEIYFNNKVLERLGISIVYREQSLQEIFSKCGEVRKNCADVVKKIRSRFGTLDGVAYCAKIFADDFLR